MYFDELKPNNPLKNWREQINNIVQQFINVTQDDTKNGKSAQDDNEYQTYVWGDEDFLDNTKANLGDLSNVDQTELAYLISQVTNPDNIKDPNVVAAMKSHKIVRSGAIFTKMRMIIQIALYLLNIAIKKLNAIYTDYNVIESDFYDWTDTSDKAKLDAVLTADPNAKVLVYNWNGSTNNIFLNNLVYNMTDTEYQELQDIQVKLQNGSIYYAMLNEDETDKQTVRLCNDSFGNLCYIATSGEKYVIKNTPNADGKYITRFQYKTADIEDAAVTHDKLAENCVMNDNIKDNTLSCSKLSEVTLRKFLGSSLLLSNYYDREALPEKTSNTVLTMSPTAIVISGFAFRTSIDKEVDISKVLTDDYKNKDIYLYAIADKSDALEFTVSLRSDLENSDASIADNYAISTIGDEITDDSSGGDKENPDSGDTGGDSTGTDDTSAYKFPYTQYRKIGGFHCDSNGYILSDSIYDLNYSIEDKALLTQSDIFLETYYDREALPKKTSNTVITISPTSIMIGSEYFKTTENIQLNLSTLSSPAGKDVYIYAQMKESTSMKYVEFALSLTELTDTNSRNIGGFHVDANGYILDYTIYDLLDTIDTKPGTVISVATNTTYTGTNVIVYEGGYLLCNGAAANRLTYSKLFAAISTKFGTGDGSTTFNLPSITSSSNGFYYFIKY